MKLRVNGEDHDLPDGIDVRGLVEALGAHPDGVAVAVNGEVVPRGQQRERALRDGDKVEVIRAVGGG